MSKVIILKTGETCGDADIRVMHSVDLVNHLSKAKRLLEESDFKLEVVTIDAIIRVVKRKAA